MRRLAAILISFTFVIAACGGGDNADGGVASLDDSATSVDTDDVEEVQIADTEAQLLAFSACMRDQGLDFDDPTVDSDGNIQLQGRRQGGGGQGGGGQGGNEGFPEAFQVCGDLLDSLDLGFRDRDNTGQQDAFLEFAECMRGEGIQIQDPDFSAGGGPGGGPGGGGIFGDLDPNDPSFEAALETCGDILGNLGGGGRGPGGPANNDGSGE